MQLSITELLAGNEGNVIMVAYGKHKCGPTPVGQARSFVFLGGASIITCNRTSNGELY